MDCVKTGLVSVSLVCLEAGNCIDVVAKVAVNRKKEDLDMLHYSMSEKGKTRWVTIISE